MKSTSARAGIAVVVSVVLVGVAATWVVALSSSTSRAETALDLIRIVLGWSVLGPLSGVAFIWVFRAQVSRFFESLSYRAARLRFPGGEAELSAQPAAVGPAPPPGSPDDPLPASETTEEASSRSAVQSNLDEASTNIELSTAVSAAEGWRQEAWKWFYEFVCESFKPHTLSILRWFAQIPENIGIKEEWLDKIVLPSNPVERTNVVSALEFRQMLMRDNGFLKATPMAREFLSYIAATHPELAWIAPSSNPLYAPSPPVSGPGQPDSPDRSAVGV